MVATVAATEGIECEVNPGPGCIKGYFLAKVMHGEGPADRAALAHQERLGGSRRSAYPSQRAN
jgi:hypothetical protein